MQFIISQIYVYLKLVFDNVSRFLSDFKDKCMKNRAKLIPFLYDNIHILCENVYFRLKYIYK